MPIQAFNHFNLRAEQALLERLRDFYVDVVGLREGPRPPFDFHGYWLYLQDQAVLHLAEVPAGGRRQATWPVKRHSSWPVGRG